MDLSNLKPAEGSTKTRKRIGRGPGSGLGGTSTRGHKALTAKLEVSAHAFSKTAEAAIVAAGGTVVKL